MGARLVEALRPGSIPGVKFSSDPIPLSAVSSPTIHSASDLDECQRLSLRQTRRADNSAVCQSKHSSRAVSLHDLLR